FCASRRKLRKVVSNPAHPVNGRPPDDMRRHSPGTHAGAHSDPWQRRDPQMKLPKLRAILITVTTAAGLALAVAPSALAALPHIRHKPPPRHQGDPQSLLCWS